MRKTVKKLSPLDGHRGKKDKFSDVVMVMLSTKGKNDSWGWNSATGLKDRKNKLK